MRMRNTLMLMGAIMIGGLCALAGCESTMRAEEASSQPDDFFLVQVSHLNASEIEAGRLAVQRASNSEVRQYGQMMIDEHTLANTELTELAELRDVTLPNEPDQLHVQLTDHLAELSGPQFDREYISAMVGDHARALAMFEDKARFANDPEIRRWAQQQVPILREHLRRAQELNRRLGGADVLIVE